MDNSPSMLRATLIGGAIFGFVGAVPILAALNCACCALVVGAGFVAAYLYSRECQRQHAPFAAGNGAIVGLVAGMFYAITNTIVGGLVQLALGADLEQVVQQIEDAGITVPQEAESMIDFFVNANPILLLFLSFCFWLLVAAVFSTIGGLIGGAVFKVERPPASGVPPTTLPPPPPPEG